MNSTQQNYKQQKAQKYEQEAYKAYESVSGKKLERNKDGTYKAQGHNDDLDAFRHAYVSAAVAQDYTAFISKIAGDEVEDKEMREVNDPKSVIWMSGIMPQEERLVPAQTQEKK